LNGRLKRGLVTCAQRLVREMSCLTGEGVACVSARVDDPDPKLWARKYACLYLCVSDACLAPVSVAAHHAGVRCTFCLLLLLLLLLWVCRAELRRALWVSPILRLCRQSTFPAMEGHISSWLQRSNQHVDFNLHHWMPMLSVARINGVGRTLDESKSTGSMSDTGRKGCQ